MISLRPLTKDDGQIYRELRLLGLQESPTAFGASYDRESVQDAEFFAKRITATDDQWSLGAFAEGRLIGVVGFVRDGGDKKRHRGAILGMYVHPEWRGQGIGRQLVVDALARTDAIAGLSWVRLGVTEGNVTAEKLYESLGFVRFGDEPEAMFVDGHYYAVHHLIRATGSNR